MRIGLIVLLVGAGAALGFLVGRANHQTVAITTVRTVTSTDPNRAMEFTSRLPVPVLAAIRKLVAPDPVAGPDQIDPSERGIWIHDTSHGNVQAIICDAVNGSEVVTYSNSGQQLAANFYPPAQVLLDPANPSSFSGIPPRLIPYLLDACP